jgi:hypothetical protein
MPGIASCGLTIEQPSSGITVHMQDESRPTLRQVDQLRTDIANVDSGLEVIMAQLARQPTRNDLARTALGIIFRTAAVSTGLVWWLIAR